GADRRRAHCRRRPGAARVPRPRAARLPRADGDREPRALRAALPRARGARAHRHAPRALRPVGCAKRAGFDVLPRDAPAARALPHTPARAVAARARRAVLRPRRGGGRAPRPRARRAARARDLPRRDTRSGTPRVARDGSAGAVMYARDVAALARKDLLLELRARETLPAMVLFVLSTLVAFRFALPGGGTERQTIGLLWVAILFTSLVGLTRAFVPEREQRVLDGLVLAPVD